MRRNLLEQFHPFAADRGFNSRKSGEVAARMRQALDQTATEGVADVHEYDWDGASLLPQLYRRRSAATHDDIRGETQRGRDIGLHATGLAALPANTDADVLSVDPAQLFQALAQCANISLCLRVALRAERKQ